jgi:beta-galactosidase
MGIGYMNGANTGDNNKYEPHITSYDYNAAISEGGDHNIGKDGLDKYDGILNAVKPFVTYSIPSEPPGIPKIAYGRVDFKQWTSLLASLPLLCDNPISSQYPKSMEQLGQAYGFVLYQTSYKAPAAAKGNLLDQQISFRITDHKSSFGE